MSWERTFTTSPTSSQSDRARPKTGRRVGAGSPAFVQLWPRLARHRPHRQPRPKGHPVLAGPADSGQLFAVRLRGSCRSQDARADIASRHLQDGVATLGEAAISDRSAGARPFPTRSAVAAPFHWPMLSTIDFVELIAIWLSCR